MPVILIGSERNLPVLNVSSHVVFIIYNQGSDIYWRNVGIHHDLVRIEEKDPFVSGEIDAAVGRNAVA